MKAWAFEFEPVEPTTATRGRGVSLRPVVPTSTFVRAVSGVAGLLALMRYEKIVAGIGLGMVCSCQDSLLLVAWQCRGARLHRLRGREGTRQPLHGACGREGGPGEGRGDRREPGHCCEEGNVARVEWGGRSSPPRWRPIARYLVYRQKRPCSGPRSSATRVMYAVHEFFQFSPKRLLKAHLDRPHARW